MIGKGQKGRKLYGSTMSLYIYFVPLLASAKKEIVRPTRPTSQLFYHYFLYYFIFSVETESVSEVSGPHDMEVNEKKNHNFCISKLVK